MSREADVDDLSGKCWVIVVAAALTEESAESEPAWRGAGQSVGLQIWRIVVSTAAKSLSLSLSLSSAILT